MDVIRVAEMFAGIGGFRLGLERASSKYKIVWANEIDKYACQIYKKNFGDETLIEKDIREIKTDNIPDHELLCAGFPCQTFSFAGKRKGTTESKGTLFTQIVRVASVKRPCLLLLENVKGLLSSSNGRDFAIILRTLGNLGYILRWQVLNSKYHGVPQNRERVFIIGHLRSTGEQEIFPIWKEPQTISEVEEIKQGDTDMITGTCTANYNSKFNDTYIQTEQGVRCLTPLEYERLQGFPDNWTRGVGEKQRYKMVGNAVTVNVIEYLGQQLLLSFGEE